MDFKVVEDYSFICKQNSEIFRSKLILTLIYIE